MRIKVLGLMALGLVAVGLAARAVEPAKTKADACCTTEKAPKSCCPCGGAKVKPDGCAAGKEAGTCAAAPACDAARPATAGCGRKTACAMRSKSARRAAKAGAKQVAAQGAPGEAKTVQK